MLNKIKQQFKKNNEIVALAILVLIAIISTSYFNFNKNKIHSNYKNILNNVYLKKTVYYFFDNLEPKFKKINHKVSPGETFDSILEQYCVSKSVISEFKKKLSFYIRTVPKELMELKIMHKFRKKLLNSINLL